VFWGFRKRGVERILAGDSAGPVSVEQEVGGSSPPNCTSASDDQPKYRKPQEGREGSPFDGQSIRHAVDPANSRVSNLPQRTHALGPALADPIEVKRRLAAIFAADVEG
jgi:hypothetical protein